MAKDKEFNFKIEGMHCAGCVSNIEKNVLGLDGVTDCRVNLAMSSAVVSVDENRIDQDKIIKKIKELGYNAASGEPDILTSNQKEEKTSRHNFFLSLSITIPLMIVAMIPMITGKNIIGIIADGIIQAVIAGVVIFYAGRSIIIDAFRQALHRHTNMNTLIAMGTLTAFGWSLYLLYVIYNNGRPEGLYFDSSAMIVTLILLGRYLEAKSKGKAGKAIKALMNLAPSKALAVINKVEIEIDASMAKEGMILIVRSGERIPADGKIIDGHGVIDEAMLTGESIPVEKKSGDTVIGGSLNGNTSFRMEVTTAGEKSFLASVIRMVSEAQGKKAPIQKIADKVASVFVPIVLGIALMTLVIWYYFDPHNPMLIKSVISVLVIACPCSLGLATPTAILVGTGRAAKEGIIIRGGDILENINLIDTVVFDKTGTLTYGELEVVEVMTFGQLSQRNLIKIVGSAEMHSEHPVAKAIVKYMKYQQIDTGIVKNMETFPGIGIKAECDGRHIVIGNKPLMDRENISYGQALLKADQEMEKGRTVVFVAVDGQVMGLLALADKIKGDAKDVIKQLKMMQKKIYMLSGDNIKTAAGVAHSLGIENYEAEILPDQKKAMVESLVRSGFKVAMVGDGINDAPALATANIGIAIGGGTDIAIETSDVILVKSDLPSLIRMFRIAQKSLKVIKQNLFWSFFYNIVALPIAAGLFYPAFGWSLSPMIAAAAMSFSSVFVVTNSLRLNRVTL